MAKSYWTKIQTPNGLKYFRADDVTDELLQKIKDEADDVFYVEYGVTTYVDALAAYNAGKSVLLLKTSSALTYIYKLVSASSTTLRFSKVDGQLQDTVALNSSDQYSDTHTTLAKTDNVMKTASAEIAPEYYDLCIEYQTEHKFPMPVGTVVTYLDNTSSDVLQCLYKSKVEIDENDYASSDPIAAPEKWDKVHVSDIAGTTFYAEMFQTPYDDIKAAYDRGETIVARMPGSGDIYQLEGHNEGQYIFSFSAVHGYTWLRFQCWKDQYPDSNDWNPQPSIVDMAQQSNIASEYDNQTTYKLGDIVYNGASLYRCIVAIDTPENWTPAHWTQTTVAAELNRLKDEQPISIYSFNNESYPFGNDIWNDVSNGKMVILKKPVMYTSRVYIMDSFGSHGNQMDVYFICLSNCNRLNLHTSNLGRSWSWTETDMYDSSLSSIGTNAVQNKTLYAIINDLQSRVSALEGN